jgi:lipopolysaccharide transport system ATP-binding protein
VAIAVKIENLSKQYRLGLVSSRTLSHDLNRWWQMNILRNEDPYLKVGETNDRSVKGKSDYVWALKDINLEIREGEVLGIIGKNGAGKSTLLKILSKVTAPTTGAIKARGRIASLLEVGTGFHQEMTGRENIFMNGAILGMKKSEIKKKLDEIIDFAGVERYIDTPVKRYSSGMLVRLGFAVAAHLEPEILIVDEVLAVGDAEFQKKAIGKMQEVSQQKGRTVLFVSHNMGAIKDLCSKGILLQNGIIGFEGIVGETIDKYLFVYVRNEHSKWEKKSGKSSQININHVEIRDKLNRPSDTIGTGDNFSIQIGVDSKITSKNTVFAIQFNDVYGNPVLTTSNSDSNNHIDTIEPGEFHYRIDFDENLFMPGTYRLIIACFESGRKLYDIIENEITIKIEDLGIKLYNRDSKGVVHKNYKWLKN